MKKIYVEAVNGNKYVFVTKYWEIGVNGNLYAYNKVVQSPQLVMPMMNIQVLQITDVGETLENDGK